jgi:hypothetical protein
MLVSEIKLTLLNQGAIIMLTTINFSNRHYMITEQRNATQKLNTHSNHYKHESNQAKFSQEDSREEQILPRH